MTLSNLLNFPSDIKLPPLLSLSAGKLSADYENGNLRAIRFGEVEVIRMIYIAIRDHNWATAGCTISEETIENSEERFAISYLATWTYGGAGVLEAAVRIEGKRDGTISLEMKGSVLQDFRRNRIGICVHHPIKECAGRQATVTKADGSSYQAAFPKLIAPHQPFLDIKNMAWSPSEEVDAVLTFSGDIFESEDQRNWGDACYKTYSTPLSIPFPVEVKKGDRIEQSMELRVKTGASAHPKQPTKAAAPLVTTPFPAIGLQHSSRSSPLTQSEIGLLQQIQFEFCRCELNLKKSGWPEDLEKFAENASKMGVGIDLVVTFTEDSSEVQTLVEKLLPHRTLLNSLLVLKQGSLVTPPSFLQSVYPLLKKAIPALKIGYGTDAYFTELNRNRPGSSTPFDFVSFSINPQVHASDTRSIMENVETLPWVIKTAKSFAQGKEVWVSPLTLKKRNNPDATGKEGGTQVGLPDSVDPRQPTNFLAAFTLLGLAGLAEADKVVLYETVGWKGVMQGETAPGQPDLFPASAHQLFPVYELLKKIREFAPVRISRSARLTWDGEVLLENSKGEQLKVTV